MELCTRCSKCYQSFEGPCSECRILEDSESEGDMEDPSELFWDNSLEVEANDADEGHCHCVSGQGSDLLRHIELAEYPDFAPADSDSSVPDSTDSEPDSGDGEFIEDDGPVDSGFATAEQGVMGTNGEATTETGGESMATGGEAMDTGDDV
ncbi:MAG: hypothetical protein Q9210_002017 [Variospora velana]